MSEQEAADVSIVRERTNPPPTSVRRSCSSGSSASTRQIHRATSASCVEWIDGLLREGGYETATFAKDPERPNLLARLKGRDQAPSLLLYGHADVVPTEGQTGGIRRSRGRTWTAGSGAGALWT
jgi:acetylornithine deacetylase/succinyl-diaminopimelate desuccinylase-like protein